MAKKKPDAPTRRLIDELTKDTTAAELIKDGSAHKELKKRLLDGDGDLEIEVSPALISKVADAVLDEVRAWQNRPLEAVWPIVYLDALHLKIRTDGRVQTRAAYVCRACRGAGGRWRPSGRRRTPSRPRRCRSTSRRRPARGRSRRTPR